jgi:hypothetical protein
MSGHGPKRGAHQIGLARRLRRVGRLADPTSAPHLVGAWAHADPAHRIAWKRASMAAALGYHPDATKARPCFHVQPDGYDTDSLVKVLEQLKGSYAAQRVVSSWDGLSAHWSHKVRTHLDAERSWLVVERLPAYAPELNPVEYLWANPNGAESANFAGDTVAEVADQTQRGIRRACDSDSLVVGFWPTPACPSTMNHHPKVKESIACDLPGGVVAQLRLPSMLGWVRLRGHADANFRPGAARCLPRPAARPLLPPRRCAV